MIFSGQTREEDRYFLLHLGELQTRCVTSKSPGVWNFCRETVVTQEKGLQVFANSCACPTRRREPSLLPTKTC